MNSRAEEKREFFDLEERILPEEALFFGKRLARFGAVGGGGDGSPVSRAMLLAVAAGVSAGGGQFWDFGDCFESQWRYCVGRSGAGLGVFADREGKLQAVSAGGLPLSAGEWRKLTERSFASSERFGEILSFSGIREFYPVELIKSAVCSLSGVTLSVKSPSLQVKGLAEEALSRLGCRFAEGGLTLQLSRDGKDVSFYDEGNRYLFTDRVKLLVCMDLFQKGEDAALPASAPRVFDRLADKMGRRVLRYADDFDSESDREARGLALRQPFLRDGIMLGIRLLSLMRKNRCSLRELEGRLPGFAVVSRVVPARKELMEGDWGVKIPGADGEIRISRRKAGLLLAAEGADAETAAELCRFAEEALWNGQLPQL